MPYNLTLTSGASLVTVGDDTVNTSITSLTLVGKNYPGYGIFLNENFISLLENFNNSTPPTAPLTGQLWYDNSSSSLRFYTGSTWKPVSTSASSPTAPSNPVVGDLWWNTLTSQLNVRGASDWVIIGPSFTATAGTSGAIVETISDTSTLSHVVVKFYISNTVVAILSKDTAFTPSPSIPGFTTINPGMNLASSSILPGSQFWGNATSAGSVGGVSLSNFLRSDTNSNNGSNTLTVGKLQAVGHLLVDPTPSDVQIYSNGSSVFKDIGLYVNRGGTQTLAQRIIASTGGVQFYANLTTVNVNPTTDNLSVIGSGTTRFANVHSVAFSGTNIFGTIRTPAQTSITSVGTLTGLAVSGTTTVNSSDLATAIANGGSSGVGNIGTAANPFNTIFARATSAQYADVAERFAADEPMLPGTVVELGGLKEITRAVRELSEDVFGVISTLPGFLLNGAAGDDNSHPPVAVNGRVPVRIVGQCRKGDRLVSAGNGLARAARKGEFTAFNVIGRALENKTTDDEGLVEAIVKINS